METTLADIAEKGDVDIKATTMVTSLDELISKVAEIISHLLDRNFEKLLWILYRVDVDEEKAKHLLSSHMPDQAPHILAELVVNRQLKKEELKKQFNVHQNPVDEADSDLML